MPRRKTQKRPKREIPDPPAEWLADPSDTMDAWLVHQFERRAAEWDGKNKGSGGPPALISPKTRARVVRLIRAGNFVDVACAAVGICKPTWISWLQMGGAIRRAFDVGQGPDPQDVTPMEAAAVCFAVEVHAALAEAEVRSMSVITSSSDWKAHAWRLERRSPDRYGRSDALRVELPAPPPTAEADQSHAISSPRDRLLAHLGKLADERVIDGEVVSSDSSTSVNSRG